MFTHQPTWDDCQQLLCILFTTEERDRIQLEARKLVPGDDGRPTSNPDLINAAFPLTRPPQDEWDYNTAEGWTEAFPTKNETAQIVAKKILEEILPRYGFPVMIGSDNGPAFVSKVSQGLASILGADWKLHCAYRPQSSRQVERMNRTLKETLTKLTTETGTNWVVLLPYALFRVRNSPYKLGLTPYEIIHGRPPPIIPNLKDNLIKAENDNSLEFLFSLQALQRVHEDVWPKLKELYETGPPPIPHQFPPGDWVLIKRHRQGTLEPRWKGPFQVILKMPTAIKVDGITTWIHFAHAKPVDPFSDLIGPSKITWTVDRTKDNPLKLTLPRQRTEL
ncbi:protein NYNRIN-like [Panthera leo]|uniref:protein NYNRIN-like n=1 Tax=Panthera leo TaxID=9689 RepID=UPI001C69C8BF|nr:protein NYNRIN-like [Panthera leo]